MTSITVLLPMFAISAILLGSISVGSGVFASNDYDSWDDDYDKKHDGKYDKHKKHSHDKKNKSEISPDSRIYVNSLSFEFDKPELHDSCDAISPPCILIDPLNMENEVFIADPELQTTRTLIQVNVHEQDNFPTTVDDIFEFPECFIVTLANFNDINGVLIECGFIESGIIDVTYSFIGPDQNFTEAVDPMSDCDCTKPTKFTVKYTGPNDVMVEIWKSKKGNSELKDRLVDFPTTFVTGDEIVIDSNSWGKDKVESNTTYVFYDALTGDQVGSVNVHTSCSKDLHVDQIWTSDDSEITLTVVSGFDSLEQESIPPLACLDV